ncbi:MAG: AAA family ATPase, partial [Chloroflexi bacterium]|nr:AAA family ATPase [Chloroflexota bacterium]
AVLSFGLRRVVSTAAVYAMRPQVFILDEPTAGLDWRSARDLLNRMARLNAEGHTILLVTHDMQLVAEYCPEMLILHEGCILAYGETRTLMGEAEALARAQIAPPQVTQLAHSGGGRVALEHPYAPRGGPQEAIEVLDEGRLPGAVLPHDGKECPSRDGHIHPIQRGDLTVIMVMEGLRTERYAVRIHQGRLPRRASNSRRRAASASPSRTKW